MIEWHGRILGYIDKICLHCGSQSLELVGHMFFSCPLAQQVWRDAPNIIWPLFAERDKLDP